MAMKCPRCSELSKEGSRSCWSCGTNFATGEQEAIGAIRKKKKTHDRPKGTGKNGRLTLDDYIRYFLGLVKTKYFKGSPEKKLLGAGGLFFLFVGLIGFFIAFFTIDVVDKNARVLSSADYVSVFFYFFFFSFSFN